jgi:hypothetical protein
MTLLVMLATATPEAIDAEPVPGASDRDPSTATCRVRYPRVSGSAVSDDLTRIVANCRGDDGNCQASTPCTGTAADRICDEARFITADAAICIARAAGLEPGLHAPKARLIYHYGFRRVIWSVENVRWRDTAPTGFSGGSSGDIFAVDAVTGEFLGKCSWESVS